MAKIDNDLKERYKDIDSDFYERQVNSINPFRRWFHVNRYRIINNLVQGKFRKGMRVVDLGCGSCNWNTGRIEVFGIDLNENLLKLAKDEFRLYDYKVGDVSDLGLNEGSFDMVLAIELLEHLHDYERLIREINRILKPGGYAIVSVPFDTPFSLWRYLFFLQVLLHGYLLGEKYYRSRCGHMNFFSPDKLKDAFLRHNFEIDTVFDMRRFTIFLIARKNPVVVNTLSCEDFTFILPTLNEGLNMRELLKNLVNYYKNAYIIVSDDGSIDNTKEIISEFKSDRIFFLDRTKEQLHGLTISVLEAIKLVKTEYFIVMDSDGQHPWRKIEEFINSLRLGNKLVLGSRIRVEGKWPLHRKIVSYGATFLGKISLLLRRKYYLSYDILSGFFGAETSFFKKLAFDNIGMVKFRLKGVKILFDFLKIVPKDMWFGEVYYEFKAREYGNSKLNLKSYWEYFRSVFM